MSKVFSVLSILQREVSSTENTYAANRSNLRVKGTPWKHVSCKRHSVDPWRSIHRRVTMSSMSRLLKVETSVSPSHATVFVKWRP